MATPKWFESATYWANKMEQTGMDSLTLAAAFKAAGYDPTSADSLYEHFEQFGKAEGIVPNRYFDEDQYYYAKAVQYYGKTNVTTSQVAAMKKAFADANLSAWQHYEQYGWTEGVSPSQAFDGKAYMQAKLAQLQADDPDAGWDMDMLEDAFTAAGLTPLTHYFEYGKDEDLAFVPGLLGETHRLTTAIEDTIGSNGNDYFFANVGELQDGDYVNGLGNGDAYNYLNQAAGSYDVLEAYLNESNYSGWSPLQPTIENVEKIIFRAQSSFHVDATNIEGVTAVNRTDALSYLQNDNSRATLIVEDLQVDSNLATIAWSNASPVTSLNVEGVDFEVYFRSQHLEPEGASASNTIHIELMDVMNSELDNVHSLQDNVWDTMVFTINGQRYTLTAETGFTGEGSTIQTMFAALTTALALPENAALAALIDITLGTEPYRATGSSQSLGEFEFDNGRQIIVTANTDDIEFNGWTSSTGEATSRGVIAWAATDDPFIGCPLIVTNIHLDNVGTVQWTDQYANCAPDEAIFGSEAGNMVVGSYDNRAGIERFDVVVDQGSWLSSLSSTNNTLRMVTVKAGDINGDGKAGNVGYLANNTDAGELFIGRSQEADSTGMGSWTVKPALLSTDGLTDVKAFDATNYDGHLNIGAQITEASFYKYLGHVDGTNVISKDYAPSGDFQYTFGNAADILNMEINGGIAADSDFVMKIDMGKGDDLVNLAFSANITDQQVRNSAKLQNVQINGGDGNDTVWTWGNGAVTVTGGAGNDAIYVGQLVDEEFVPYDADADAGGTPGEQNAVWVFNTDLANREVFVSEVAGAQPLDNNFLALRDEVAVTSTGTEIGDSLYVTVTFKGFAATAVVANSALTAANGNASVSTLDINRAIISAIENDATLSKVLVAGTDGAGHGLMIQALIDGLMTLDDLGLAFDFRNAIGDTSKGTAVLTGESDLGTYDTNFAQYADANPASVTTVTTPLDFALDNFVLGSTSQSTVDLLVNDYANVALLEENDVFSITFGGVTYSTTVTAAQAGAANVEAQVLALLGVVDTVGDGSGTDLVTLWTAAAGTADDGTIELTSVADDVADPATVSAEFDRDEVGLAFVDGTDTGTHSINRVMLDGGNDVITLNAEAEAGNDWFDTLVINQAFGNDKVFNFTTGDDKIDLSAYGRLTDAVSATLDGNGALTTTAMLAALNAGAVFNTAGANTKGAALVQHGSTNLYTVVQVINATTDGLVADEVTVLGTIQFDDTTGTIQDGDLIGA